MGIAERLRGLERRAEAYGKRFERRYDTEPPMWLKHAWLLIFLGPLTLPLTIATSPLVSVVVLSVVLVPFCVAAFRWRVKHRL